ncbi:DUF4214 domain-containing protein, partial [Halomonas campisalis]
MATQESLDLVQKLYVAYYGRPADPSGQQYWAEQIDERGIDAVINDFGTSPEFDARFGSMSNEQLVNNLYFQLFGRSAEAEGLAFYVDHLEAGNLTLAEIALTIAGGAQNEDAVALDNKLAVAQSFTDAIDDPNEITAYQGNNAANTARQFLVNVNENTDPAAVDVDGFIAQLVKAAGQPSTQNVFTLTEIPTQTETTLSWNGVDVEDALAFLQSVSDLTLEDLGIEVSGDKIVNVENVNISDSGDNSTITVTLLDGSVFEATIDTPAALFAEIIDGLQQNEEVTQTGIVLTPTQNNGGAFESGYTTSANDLIIAGRPELLHGAYIDGGGGYNVLEVDMKGFFAQPFQLKNIQEVQVQNLPNYYQVSETIFEDANFPMPDIDGGASILDLSRARELEKLVINEGGAFSGEGEAGALHLLGIEGSATARLEGNFTQDVNLYYGRGLGDAVELELANVTMNTGNLALGHNAGTVNLLSEGRLNVLENADFGEFLRELNVSGSGELVINSDLQFAFGEAHVDASANTGGLRLGITASDNLDDADGTGGSDLLQEVTVLGSQARDVIAISGTEAGVVLNVDTNAGRDTLILDGVDAGRGSKIAGSELTLHIKGDVELDLVNTDDVTVDRVVLHQSSKLTLNQEQFALWGGVLETNHRDTVEIEVIISEDTSLSELMADFDLDSNIKLSLIVEKGATLTLTAEELHKYVAEDGIEFDAEDGPSKGFLVITEAGLQFDATGQSNYSTGGTISGWGDDNLTIERSFNGFERPDTVDSLDVLTIDTDLLSADDQPIGDIETGAQTLVITGSQDVVFDGYVELNGGDGIFFIDFSELEGTVEGLTIKNFDQIYNTADDEWGSIIGNNTGTRIDVMLAGDVGEASPDPATGLPTQGVAEYVVVDLGGEDRFFNISDSSQDLEQVGLKGNQGYTLTFNNLPFGSTNPEILLEGDGFANFDELSKAAGDPNASNIGTVEALWFRDGEASGVFNINNAGVTLGATSTGGTRSLHVDGIITNAGDVTINVADGDAIIGTLEANYASSITVNSNPSDVQLWLDGSSFDEDVLETIDMSGVDGTAVLGVGEHVDTDDFSFSGFEGGVIDLSNVELIGIDAIALAKDSELTLNVNQLQEIDLIAAFDVDEDSATLNVANYDGSEFDFGTLDQEGIDVGTVTFLEGEDIVVDPATDFTGIDQLVIPEGTNVTISAE